MRACTLEVYWILASLMNLVSELIISMGSSPDKWWSDSFSSIRFIYLRTLRFPWRTAVLGGVLQEVSPTFESVNMKRVWGPYLSSFKVSRTLLPATLSRLVPSMLRGSTTNWGFSSESGGDESFKRADSVSNRYVSFLARLRRPLKIFAVRAEVKLEPGFCITISKQSATLENRRSISTDRTLCPFMVTSASVLSWAISFNTTAGDIVIIILSNTNWNVIKDFQEVGK